MSKIVRYALACRDLIERRFEVHVLLGQVATS